MTTRITVNSGFWDLPASQRAQAMQAACDQYQVSDFWDLDPDQRGAVYDRAVGDWYGGGIGWGHD
jgi:hypothetical protein